MEIITTSESIIVKSDRLKTDSYALQSFTESPRKAEDDLPAGKLGAFDLFNLFTADIIRSKETFTR